jgi:hypothetical protein
MSPLTPRATKNQNEERVESLQKHQQSTLYCFECLCFIVSTCEPVRLLNYTSAAFRRRELCYGLAAGMDKH